MRCLQQQCWAGGVGGGGGGGGGGMLPYIYLHEMSVGGCSVGAGRYVDEVNSRQLMALFQVMYDPHQSTTVIKPVRIRG